MKINQKIIDEIRERLNGGGYVPKAWILALADKVMELEKRVEELEKGDKEDKRALWGVFPSA